MSSNRCDSGHSLGQSTSCTHCTNVGLVNGEIIVAYDPANNKPEVKSFRCKYCGVSLPNQINPHNLKMSQAEWNAYMAM